MRETERERERDRREEGEGVEQTEGCKPSCLCPLQSCSSGLVVKAPASRATTPGSKSVFVEAICTPHVLQRSKDHPEKQLQNGVATTPRHWDRSGQHPPAGQSSSSHLDLGAEEDSIHQLDRAAQVTIFKLRTGHCPLLSHLHRLKISHSNEFPCGTVPHPSAPLHLGQFETPDMAQSGGYPQEALGT